MSLFASKEDSSHVRVPLALSAWVSVSLVQPLFYSEIIKGLTYLFTHYYNAAVFQFLFSTVNDFLLSRFYLPCNFRAQTPADPQPQSTSAGKGKAGSTQLIQGASIFFSGRQESARPEFDDKNLFT